MPLDQTDVLDEDKMLMDYLTYSETEPGDVGIPYNHYVTSGWDAAAASLFASGTIDRWAVLDPQRARLQINESLEA